MRYTLWSNGQLVGHTNLDIPTVTEHLRQGFIEPTDEGIPLLRAATGVVRAIAEERRARRARGGKRVEGDLEPFIAACNAREALNLMLRDEDGEVMECDFMRVYDLQSESDDLLLDDADADRNELLESLSPEDRARMEAEFAEADAEVDEMFDEWVEERNDEEMFHSSWPPPAPPDARWETMRYHLQVFLPGACELDDVEF